jgi:phage terminase large subunit
MATTCRNHNVAYASTALERLLVTAREAGAPQDQMRRFRLANYVPQPKQLQFHAIARLCDAPDGPSQVGFGGARGPGKSHGVFAQLALDDCQRRPGLKALYLRRVGKRAREQLEDLRLAVLHSIPHDYNRSEAVVNFPNGSRIIVGHFKDEKDVDSYLGLQYDVEAIEETTSLTVTKYRALRDSNRTSRLDWRPRIYTTTNPGGVGHAWYKHTFIEPWRLGREGDTRFIFGTVEDNAFVDPDYQRKLQENTGWRLRAYRYGDWDISAGQFFTTFRRDVHVIKPFPIPHGWRVWCSLDYGFVHYTIVHLHAMDGEGVIHTVDEHAARQWHVTEHVKAIRQMLDRWGVEVNRLWTFVAGQDVFTKRDPGPTIAQHYARLGLHLRPANMDRVNGWAEMLARLGDVERGLAPRWYIFDTCKHLVETLPTLEHDPHRPEDVLKIDIDEDGLGGDDAGDCARYGLMALGKPRRARRTRRAA